MPSILTDQDIENLSRFQPAEPSSEGDIRAALSVGARSTAKLGVSAVAAIADIFDQQELRDSLIVKMQDIDEGINDITSRHIATTDQIHSPSDFWDYLQFNGVQVIPTMAAIVATSGIGAITGKTIAEVIAKGALPEVMKKTAITGAIRGGVAGASAGIEGMALGDLYQETVQAGQPDPMRALALSAPYAAIDALQIVEPAIAIHYLGKTFKGMSAMEKIAELAKRVAIGGGVGSVGGGVEESAQEKLLMAARPSGTEVPEDQADYRVKQSFYGGAAGGLVPGLLSIGVPAKVKTVKRTTTTDMLNGDDDVESIGRPTPPPPPSIPPGGSSTSNLPLPTESPAMRNLRIRQLRPDETVYSEDGLPEDEALDIVGRAPLPKSAAIPRVDSIQEFKEPTADDVLSPVTQPFFTDPNGRRLLEYLSESGVEEPWNITGKERLRLGNNKRALQDHLAAQKRPARIRTTSSGVPLETSPASQPPPLNPPSGGTPSIIPTAPTPSPSVSIPASTVNPPEVKLPHELETMGFGGLKTLAESLGIEIGNKGQRQLSQEIWQSGLYQTPPSKAVKQSAAVAVPEPTAKEVKQTPDATSTAALPSLETGKTNKKTSEPSSVSLKDLQFQATESSGIRDSLRQEREQRDRPAKIEAAKAAVNSPKSRVLIMDTVSGRFDAVIQDVKEGKATFTEADNALNAIENEGDIIHPNVMKDFREKLSNFSGVSATAEARSPVLTPETGDGIKPGANAPPTPEGKLKAMRAAAFPTPNSDKAEKSFHRRAKSTDDAEGRMSRFEEAVSLDWRKYQDSTSSKSAKDIISEPAIKRKSTKPTPEMVQSMKAGIAKATDKESLTVQPEIAPSETTTAYDIVTEQKIAVANAVAKADPTFGLKMATKEDRQSVMEALTGTRSTANLSQKKVQEKLEIHFGLEGQPIAKLKEEVRRYATGDITDDDLEFNRMIAVRPTVTESEDRLAEQKKAAKRQPKQEDGANEEAAAEGKRKATEKARDQDQEVKPVQPTKQPEQGKKTSVLNPETNRTVAIAELMQSGGLIPDRNAKGKVSEDFKKINPRFWRREGTRGMSWDQFAQYLSERGFIGEDEQTLDRVIRFLQPDTELKDQSNTMTPRSLDVGDAIDTPEGETLIVTVKNKDGITVTNGSVSKVPASKKIEGSVRPATPDELLEAGNKMNDMAVAQEQEEEVIEPPLPPPVEDELQDDIKPGDIIRDNEGNDYLVKNSRHGNAQAYPIVNGKPLVNNESGVMFATSEMSKVRNPDYRTDYEKVGRQNLDGNIHYKKEPVKPVEKFKEEAPTIEYDSDNLKHGTGESLYLYNDLSSGILAWAKNPDEFRTLTGVQSDKIVRVSHKGIKAPDGYTKQGILANDPIKRQEAPPLTLESISQKDLVKEKKVRGDSAKIAADIAKPLSGNTGNLGVVDLLDNVTHGDLWSQAEGFESLAERESKQLRDAGITPTIKKADDDGNQQEFLSLTDRELDSYSDRRSDLEKKLTEAKKTAAASAPESGRILSTVRDEDGELNIKRFKALSTDEMNAVFEHEDDANNVAKIQNAIHDLSTVHYSLTPENRGFYSRIIRAVENAKATKTTGAQWKAIIKADKAGVNMDEWALTSVDDLENSKSYTKAEVLEYLRGNEIVIKDVTLGDKPTLKVVEHPTRPNGFALQKPDGSYVINDNSQYEVNNSISDQVTGEPIFWDRKDYAESYGISFHDKNAAKFSSLQLPGAKEDSYREVLLTVPEFPSPIDQRGKRISYLNEKLKSSGLSEKEYTERIRLIEGHPYDGAIKENWTDGHSQYSSIANPIVRLRLNERTTSDGKRILFIEEVQMPLGKRWYEVNGKEFKNNESAQVYAKEHGGKVEKKYSGELAKVPDLFRDNAWTIAFKWAFRHAAENGFDSVGYTTGDQQAERYDLSKHLSGVNIFKNSSGDFNISAWDKEGNNVIKKNGLTANEVESHIGKELAEKARNQAVNEQVKYEGLDLKVGGEGLKKLYDVDFHNVVNGLPAVKKAGQKVGMVKIGTSPSGDAYVRNFGQGYEVIYNGREVGRFGTKKLAMEHALSFKSKQDSIHAIAITPEMVESIMAGQPRFSLDGQAPVTRQQPMALEDVERIANKFLSIIRKVIGINIVVVTDGTKLPPLAIFKKADPSRVAGVLVTNEKGESTVYINAANVFSEEQLEGVILHEIVGHFGIENMLSMAEKTNLFEAIWISYGGRKGFESIIQSYFPDGSFNVNLRGHRFTVVREMIARLSEGGKPQQNILQKIVAAVKKWLREHGFKIAEKITDNDIKYLISQSRKYVGLDSMPSVFDLPIKESAPRVIKFNGGILSPPGTATSIPKIIAFHGTPHSVDKFSTKKIGTGEGAQVYGWGLYFTDKPEIADYYKKNLEQRLGWGDVQIRGNRYHVELDADPDELLDWDKPLSEQSERVKKAIIHLSVEVDVASDPLDALGGTKKEKQIFGLNNPTGAAIYEDLQRFGNPLIKERYDAGEYPMETAKIASEYLAAQGIKGIRYLDAGSRDRFSVMEPTNEDLGRWTIWMGNDRIASAENKEKALQKIKQLEKERSSYNYVIFNENDIKITGKNGETITPTEAMKEQGVESPDTANAFYSLLSGEDSTLPPSATTEKTDPDRDPIAKARPWYLNLLSRRMIVDLYDKIFKGGLTTHQDLWTAMEKWKSKRINEDDKVATRIYDLMVDAKQVYLDLSDILYEGTFNRLTPHEDYKPIYDVEKLREYIRATRGIKKLQDAGETLTEKQAARLTNMDKKIKNAERKIEFEANRKAVYDRIAPMLKKMKAAKEGTPEHAAGVLYDDILETFDRVHKDLRVGLINRLKRQFTDLSDPALKAAIEAIGRSFDKAKEKGIYFPLSRFGKFYATAKLTVDGVVEDWVVKNFNSNDEMLEFKRDMEKAGYDVDINYEYKPTSSDKNAIPVNQMTSDLFRAIDDAGIKGIEANTLKDSINQLVIKTMPDSTYRKHYIHRKEVKGFTKDMLRTFTDSTFRANNHIGNINYADQLAANLRELEAFMKKELKGKDRIIAPQVLKQLDKNFNWEMSHELSPAVALAGSLGFFYNLGYGISSAAINASQVAMWTYPRLAAELGKGGTEGWGRSTDLLKQAYFDITGFKVDDKFTVPKLSGKIMKEGYDFRARLSKFENDIMDEIHDRNIIDLTTITDLAFYGKLDFASKHPKVPIAIWRAQHAMASAFHFVEILNRQVTALSAIRAAQDIGITDKEGIVRFVEKMVYDTQGDYSKSNRAYAMKGNLARVLFMFKTYAHAMIYQMARAAAQSVNGESPEIRMRAAKYFTGVMATHFMVSGLAGLPIMTAFTLANLVAKAFGDDDDPIDMETSVRNQMAKMLGAKGAEVIDRGIFRLTPWDISSRVTIDPLSMVLNLPDKHFRDGKEQFDSAVIAMLGPAAGNSRMMWDGLTDMASGDFYRGAEKAMPKFIRDTMKASRFAFEGGAKDAKGEPIVNDLGIMELAGQFVGFNPARLAEEYKQRGVESKLTGQIKDRRSEIINDYIAARQSRKFTEIRDILKEVRKFNKVNPESGLKITEETLDRSYKNRLKKISGEEKSPTPYQAVGSRKITYKQAG